MKHFITAILMVSNLIICYSQDIQLSVISSGGYSTSDCDWTIGQPFINVIGDDITITQGFQQGNSFEPTSVKTESDVKISVFPNPVINYLNIKVNDNKQWKANIFDLSGKSLLIKTFNDEIQLDLSDYPASAFILKLSSLNNLVTFSIVKQ